MLSFRLEQYELSTCSILSGFGHGARCGYDVFSDLFGFVAHIGVFCCVVRCGCFLG